MRNNWIRINQFTKFIIVVFAFLVFFFLCECFFNKIRENGITDEGFKNLIKPIFTLKKLIKLHLNFKSF